MANAMQYIANIGKSVAYSSVDRLKKTSPAIGEFAEQNAELGKVLYQSVRDYKGTQKKIKDYVTNSIVGEAAVEYKNAIFEDIRTGKFYNRERIDRLQAKYSGGLLDGFDDDPFANMESDFGGGSSSSSSKEFDTWGDDIGDDDVFLADTMDQTGSKVTQGVAMATARSAEYQVKASRQNVNILTKHAEMMFGKVNAGMAALNSNVSSLIEFNNKAMLNHIENSKNFYEVMTKNSNLTNEYLKKLVDMQEQQQKMYQEAEKKSSENIGYGDIVSADGTVDLKAYFQRIKKNASGMSGGFMDQLKAFGDGSNMLAMMAASPLQFITDKVAEQIIPNIVEQSLSSLNDTISGFFGNMMLKLNSIQVDDFDGGLFGKAAGFIKEMFGINTGIRSGVDTGKYKKGPIPWDGESKMALTNVIPGLLSKILAAVSGTEERMFDYGTGKWKTVSGVVKEHKDKLKNASTGATKEVRDELVNMITKDNLMMLNRDQEEKLIKDIEKMLDKSFKDRKLLPVGQLNLDKVSASDLGVDPENLKFILPLLNNLTRTDKGRKALKGYGNNVMSGIDSYNKYMKGLEDLPNAIERAIFDGFNAGEFVAKDDQGRAKAGRDNINSAAVVNNIAHVRDDKGNTVFTYLQRIDKYLYDVRGYMESGTGHGRGRKRGASINASRPSDNDGYSIRNTDVLKKWEKEEDNRKGKYHTESELNKRHNQKYLRRLKKHYHTNNPEIAKLIDSLDPESATFSDEMEFLKKHGWFDQYIFEMGPNQYGLEDQKVVSQLDDYFQNQSHLKDLEQQRKADSKRKKPSLSTGGKDSPEETRNKLLDMVSGVSELAQAPAKFMANLIHKVDQRMFQVIYGNEKEDQINKNSFMGALMDKLNRTFNTFTDFLKDNLVTPFSDFIHGHFDELFGNLKEKWKEAWGDEGILKKMFGNKIDYVKNAFKDVYVDPIKRVVNGETRDDFELPPGFESMADYKKWWIANEKRKHASHQYYQNGNIEALGKLGGTKQVRGKDGIMREGVDRQSDMYRQISDIRTYERESKGILTKEERNALEKDARFGAIIDPNDPKKKRRGDGLNGIYRTASSISSGEGNIRSYEELMAAWKNEKDADKKAQLRQQLRNATVGRRAARSRVREMEAAGFSTQEIADRGYYDIIHQMYGKKRGRLKGASIDMSEISRSDRLSNYYAGGEVQKTGIAAVSEGELIIPAEYNPFYKGGKSRLTRKNDEDKAKRNFVDFLNSLKNPSQIHGHVYGVTDTSGDIPDDNGQTRANKLGRKISDAVGKISDDEEGPSFRHRDYDDENWNANDEFIAAHYKEGSEPLFARINKDTKSLLPVIKASGNQWLKRLSNSSSRLDKAYAKMASDMEEAAGSQDQDKLWNDMVEDVTGDFSKYLPSMLGGGIIGSGVSLVTGAVGGPLLGFAVGAGLDLITQSDKVKDWLFGEKDENGERKGNVLSKDLVNNINKYFPDMAKGAVVGGITSILPFVPGGAVSGIILGSAIGFAKNNDKIMSALFGEMDDDGRRTQGGLINTKLRGKIQESLPRMILGGAIGAFTGPFGPVGNILLGSAVGFATKLDAVTDALFGKLNEETGEREGGVVGFISDKVVEPIGRAFDPLVKQGELLFKGFADHIKNKVDGILDEKLGVPLSRIFKEKVVDRAVRAGKFVGRNVFMPGIEAMTAPFQMIEGFGDRLRRKHIANGNADYMTALQRQQYRQELKDRKVYEKYTENVYEDVLGPDGKPTGEKRLVHRKGDLKKDDFGNYIDTGKKKAYVFKRMKKDKYRQFDDMLASRNTSYESLIEMRDGLRYLQDPEKQGKKMRHDAIHNINKMIGKNYDIDLHDAQKISEDLANNNFEGAIKRVKRLGLDAQSEGKLIRKLTAEYSNLKTVNKLTSDTVGQKNKVFKKLQGMGFKDLNEKTVGRYANLLDQEIKNKEEMGLDKFNNEQERRYEGIVKAITGATDAIKAIWDPSYRDSIKTRELNENIGIAGRRRGILHDSGNNGLFGGGNYKYEVIKGKTYRVNMNTGKKVEVDPDTLEALNKEDDEQEFIDNERDYFSGTSRNTRFRNRFLLGRQRSREIWNGIKNTSRERYTENVYEDIKDEDGKVIDKKLIHKKGDFINNRKRDVFGRNFYNVGRAAGSLFRLNRTDDEIAEIRAAEERKNNKNLYKKNWKNQLSALENAIANAGDSSESIRLQGILNQLKDAQGPKGKKKDYEKLFTNNANLFKDAFKSRKRMDGSTEGTDENTMYVANSQGKPIKWIKDSEGRWTVDRNDSDNNVYDDAEEENKSFRQKLMDKFTGIGDGIVNGFNRIFKIDNERDTLTKKILKVGTGILGALTIAGMMPVIESAWKNKIKPGLGQLWDEKIYPVIAPYIEPIKPTIARAAAGIDATINKIPSAIDNLTIKVGKFITNDLPAIWTEKIIPFYEGGIEWIGERMGNVAEGLSFTILKLAPSLIKGAIKGIWKFLKTDMTDLFMGYGNVSSSELLKSGAAYKDASGSAAAFGSTSMASSMENFSGASGLYQRLFGETTAQTLGTSNIEAEMKSKEAYYGGVTDAYSENDGEYDENYEDMYGSGASGERSSTPSTKRNKTSKSTNNSGIADISAAEMEAYAASAGNDTAYAGQPALRKKYDENVQKNKKNINKIQQAQTNSVQAKENNSATKAGGNFNISTYNAGTQDLVTSIDNTKATVKNDLSYAKDMVTDWDNNGLLSSVFDRAGSIMYNASRGKMQAYDVTKKNAMTDVGGMLEGCTVDQATGLVYDVNGHLLANTFYDPSTGEITNRLSEAALAQWPNIANDYNTRLKAEVNADPTAYQYSNGASYIDEDGLYTEAASSYSSPSNNKTDFISTLKGENNTVFGRMAFATSRNLLPGTGLGFNALTKAKIPGKGIISKSLNKTKNIIMKPIAATDNLLARTANSKNWVKRAANYSDDLFLDNMGKFTDAYVSGAQKASKDKMLRFYKMQLQQGKSADEAFEFLQRNADQIQLSSASKIEDGVKGLNTKFGMNLDNMALNSKSDDILRYSQQGIDDALREISNINNSKAAKKGSEALVRKVDGALGNTTISKLTNTAKNVSDNGGLRKTISGKVKDFLQNGKVKQSFISSAGSEIGEEAAEEAFEKLVPALGDDVGEFAAKGALKAGGKIASKLAAAAAKWIPIAGWIITGVTVIYDFIKGMDDAATYLGMTDEDFSGFVEKCNGNESIVKFICGAVNALNNNLLLGIIPTGSLIDLFVSHIGPFLGIDAEELKAARESSAAEIAKYNALNNTNHNIESYNDLSFREKGIQVTKESAHEKGVVNQAMSENKARLDALLSNTKFTSTKSNRNYLFIHKAGSGSGLKTDSFENVENQTTTQKIISQLDPKYKNIKFNSAQDTTEQTLGSDGCGPAVVTMAINKIKADANLNIEDAAKFAIEKGDKEVDGGTNLKFFKDIYAKYGMGTNFTDNFTAMKSEVESGKPVILLGHNSKNNNKSVSPFGPNNHYVLADGIEGKNIIIRDPEQNKVVKYRMNDILSQTRVAITPTESIGFGNAKDMDKYMSYSASGFNYNNILNAYENRPSYRVSINRMNSGSGNIISGGNSRLISPYNRPSNHLSVYLNGAQYSGSGSSYSLRELAHMSAGNTGTNTSTTANANNSGTSTGNANNSGNTNSDSKSGNTTEVMSNLAHSENITDELINIISQFKGSMSFSAVNWKGNAKYGLFLWSGKKGAELLYNIVQKDKASALKLFGTNTSTYNRIIKKEVLKGKEVMKNVRKIIIKLISSTDGKKCQADMATQQIMSILNNYKKKFNNAKTVMFLSLIHYIDNTIASELAKDNNLNKDSEMSDVYALLKSEFPTTYTKYNNEFNYAFYYIEDSNCTNTNPKAANMDILEKNISTSDVAKEEESGTWLDELWSGLADLGNILFGMSTSDDEETTDEVENSNAATGQVSDIDMVNLSFKTLNDESKTLAERFAAIKSIYNASSMGGDADAGYQTAIILFENSSLFTLLCQFDYFKDTYGNGVTQVQFNKSGHLIDNIKLYETQTPCVNQKDAEGVGGAQWDNMFSITTVTDENKLKNFKTKYESLTKKLSDPKKYIEELKSKMNGKDYENSDNPYHMGYPNDNDTELYIYKLFRDQLNWFMINGQPKDKNKLTAFKDNTKDDFKYNEAIKAYTSNKSSASGSFNNDFFNKVAVCNNSFIKKLKSKSSRKEIIEFLKDYILNNLEADVNAELFYNPLQKAKAELAEQWEILGGNYELSAKESAWEQAEKIINSAYIENALDTDQTDQSLSNIIQTMNQKNVQRGLNEVHDFDYAPQFIYGNMSNKTAIRRFNGSVSDYVQTLRKTKTQRQSEARDNINSINGYNIYNEELKKLIPQSTIDSTIEISRKKDSKYQGYNIFNPYTLKRILSDSIDSGAKNKSIVLRNKDHSFAAATLENLAKARFLWRTRNVGGYDLNNTYGFARLNVPENLKGSSNFDTIQTVDGLNYKHDNSGTMTDFWQLNTKIPLPGINSSISGKADYNDEKYTAAWNNLWYFGSQKGESEPWEITGDSEGKSFGLPTYNDIDRRFYKNESFYDQMDDETKELFDTYYFDIFKQSGKNFEYGLDNGQDNVEPKSKDTASNRNNMFEALNRYMAYKTMYGDNEKAYADAIETARRQWITQSLVNKEFERTKGMDTNALNRLPFNEILQDVNVSKKDHDAIISGALTEGMMSSPIGKKYAEYLNKHYMDYYTPSYLAKAFYEQHVGMLTPTETITNEDGTTTQQLNTGSIASTLKNVYTNLYKNNKEGVIGEPTKEEKEKLLNGSATEALYKKYYAWCVQSGIVPNDGGVNKTPTKFGFEDSDDPNNWIYPGSSLDKKQTALTQGEDYAAAIRNGIIPSYYARAKRNILGWKVDDPRFRRNPSGKDLNKDGDFDDANEGANWDNEKYGLWGKLFGTSTDYTTGVRSIDLSDASEGNIARYAKYIMMADKKSFIDWDQGGRVGGTIPEIYKTQISEFQNILTGSGSGISAGSSGFVSQFDYKNKKFLDGDSLAEYGCGPAVAAMAINNMKSAGNSLMDQTAALANKYKDANGTQAQYFNDVFGRAGMSTEYIHGSGMNKSIESNLNAGNQVVLMGNDPSNNNKSNSPFGPSNHYVLATGVGNNKIQISDPEQRAPRVYDKNKILNNTQLGVAVGSGAFSAGASKKIQIDTSHLPSSELAKVNALNKSLAKKAKKNKDKADKDFVRYTGSAKHWNLCSWSEITAEEIDAFIKKKKSSSPFKGSYFIEAAEKSGLDPRYILAHAAIESAWGTSNLAKKGNFFGIGAYDSNPINSDSTGKYANSSVRTGIINGAVWIKNNYYNKGQTTVYLMRHDPNGSHNYCISNTWENSIASIMQEMPENKLATADQSSLDTETKIGVDGGAVAGVNGSTSDSNSTGNWISDLSSDFEELGKILAGTNTVSSSSNSSGGDFSSDGSWVSIVKAVKSAIAAQSPGYSQSNHIDITVNGQTKSVRTDCSGFVSACLQFYGAMSGVLNSSGFTNKSASIKGFTAMDWPGWDSLVEGDIIAKDGHVEIFARNEGGIHYVYNCGSDSSVNNPNATKSAKSSYTTVWKSTGGSGSGLRAWINKAASAGKSGFIRNNIIGNSRNVITAASAAGRNALIVTNDYPEYGYSNSNNKPKLGTGWVNRTLVGNGSTSHGSRSGYLGQSKRWVDTGLVGKLTEGYDNTSISTASGSGYVRNTIRNIAGTGTPSRRVSASTKQVINSIGRSGRSETIKTTSAGKSKVYYEDYRSYSAGASNADTNTEVLLTKAIELLAKITNNTANVGEVIKLLNKIIDITKKKESAKGTRPKGTTRADREIYSGGSSKVGTNNPQSAMSMSAAKHSSESQNNPELDRELELLISNLSDIARG